jgi:glycosyltransferase involved in cell wall biosynthesis
MHGQVPRERLGDFYRAADVLCVSSWHEMQPAVALEAGFSGLPIVGTEVGLLPDLAPHGVITCSPGDADALAAALIQTATGERGSQICAALQSRVRAEFLAEHTSKAILTLYTGLCSAAAPERPRAMSRPPVTASVVNDVSDD